MSETNAQERFRLRSDARDKGYCDVGNVPHYCPNCSTSFKAEPEQLTPRDSREAVIEKKLTEILLGMDHATGDRDLQIWIAAEGINEALALLREKGE